MEGILQFFRQRPAFRTASLLAGALVCLVGFFLVPLFYLLAISFAARSPYGTVDWLLGFHNYIRAFQPLYLGIYWRSLGMALKRLGDSLNSTNPEEIRRARDLLLAQKPLVRGYNSSNFEQDLVAGEAWIAQAYNGNLTFAMRDEPGIRYVIPKEGCTISVDLACIPRQAPHQDLAHEFINYFHRPEVAAAFINDSGFNSPNAYARSHVESWILAEPAIFPRRDLLVNCEFMRDLGPVVALYDRYWTEIKAR